MKNKNTRKFAFLFIFLLVGAISFAQSISGNVISEDGPLPGATIVVEGTTDGTTSDFDGNFTINANVGDVLLVSFVGYVTRSVTIENTDALSIKLEVSSALDEVIITGYSAQTKGSVTGAVASVNVGDAIKVPVVNAAETLQGRVAGVTVVGNGQPGSAPVVRVRGYGTPNDNNPLYIIDGTQTNDPFVLNNINPDDIAQMNVLKDAAAAIYGSRASNGVIIITTKSGKGGQLNKARVNLDVSYGSSQASNLPTLLTAQQLGQVFWESYTNDGAPLSHPQYGTGASPVVPTTLDLQGRTYNAADFPLLGGQPIVATVARPTGTDWLGAIFRTAPTFNFALSVSNQGERSAGLISINFLEREGVQINTGYTRGGIRINSSYDVADYLTIGQHMNLTYDVEKVGNQVQEALRSSPLIPLRDDAGQFAGIYSTSFGLGNSTSPYANLIRGRDNYNRSLRALGDVYAEIRLAKGLSVKSTFGGTLRNFNRRTFAPSTPEAETNVTPNLVEQDFAQFEWVWTNIAEYKTTINDKSNLNVLVGYEAVESFWKGKTVSRSEFLFQTPSYYTLFNGENPPIVEEAGENSNTLASFFGSVDYSYEDKYFFRGTLRSDRTSRFAPENQSDIFPSVSLGWAIANESFFNSTAVSNLKLRLSYGQLGNQQLPAANPDVNISGLSQTNGFYAFNGAFGGSQPGAILQSVGNANLTWETSESTNIGIDFGFLDGKLTGYIDYYTLNSKDLIVRDNFLIGPTAIDAGAPFVNFGDIKNTGVDLSVNYSDETSSGFYYGVTLNLSTYKNEVVSLVNDTPITGDGSLRGGAVTRTEVGQPISTFYGREVIGIFANQAEVDAAPTQEGAAPGRFRYADINGDGVINDMDRTTIGSPHPDFTYGVNLNFAYKGVDLSLFFNGVQGNDIYNYSKIFTDFPTFFNGNRSTRVLDSWSASNLNASLPALSQSITNNETQPNSFFVEDGSFLRLRSLQVGYNFDSTLINPIGLSSLRLYLSGTNLFTITNYDGLDPEVVEINATTLGVDQGNYPLPRILTVGLNIKF